MKTLIAIDASQKAQHVIDTVASRPWPSGTVFCVMSVIDMGRWEGMPTLIEDATHEANGLVKNATHKLAQAGHEVFSEVRAGLPRKAIPEYATHWGADLVIVGSHGQSALTRFLLGSVSQAVLRNANCSVEIVRHGIVFPLPTQGFKILLATDGSTCSAKAINSVAHRPWPANSAVRIVSVVQLPAFENQGLAPPSFSPYPSGVLEQMWNDARKRAGEAIAEARKALGALNMRSSDVTPVGEPRVGILDEAKAWGADLIVLGSHGKHGMDRILLGSVSESVALYANCSVEIIR
jgi:nucleotide-binding universal stress UspA family protein